MFCSGMQVHDLSRLRPSTAGMDWLSQWLTFCKVVVLGLCGV